MQTLTFAGIEGRINHISDDNEYVTLGMSEQITIIGSVSNPYNWDETIEEEDSPFSAFITYIGTDGSIQDLNKIYNFLNNSNAYFRHGEQHPRNSKRTCYKLEIKVRGLSSSELVKLINEFDNQNWQAA